MASRKVLSIMLAAGASLFVVMPAMAQEDTNYYGYDKSFIDRPDHKKPTNPFAAKADDFHKHSYRRMLLNSPFAQSSIGLGANSQNQLYNNEAYTYMNPDSFKANDATPDEVNRYIDHVYAPNVGKSENQGYQTDKGFDQPNPFKAGSETRSSLTEENPFGSTFDTGKNSPYAQNNSNPRKSGLLNQRNYSNHSYQKPASSPVSGDQLIPLNHNADTSQSNF